jgi:peroxiredoxin
LRKNGPALTVLLLVLLAACTKSNQPGTAAADFTLKDLNGKSVTLSDFKGKPVLIEFWATWCPPCRLSVPGLEKLHKRYSSKGLVVLGISVDQEWDTVKTFAAENGVTYTVLKGDDDVITKYQVRTIPMLIIMNKEGNIAKRYLGFDDEEALDKDIQSVL